MQPTAASGFLPQESNQAQQGVDAPIDFAILTALEVERRAVCAAFHLTDQHRVKKDGRVYWRGKLLIGDGATYDVVIAQPVEMGQTEATALATEVAHVWKPRVVLMVGIAASTKPGEVKLGDVVVGSSVYYYEHGKITAEGINPQPVMIQADANLLKHYTGLPDWDRVVLARPPGEMEAGPRVFLGVIASGDKVVAHAPARDAIAAEQRKILALEMEGYGFSHALWLRRIPHLVIRGISDDGSEHKTDDWQYYAAASAAGFVRHFLLDRPLEQAEGSAPSTGTAAGADDVANQAREAGLPNAGTGSGSHPEQPQVGQRVTSTTGGNPASQVPEISNEPLEWDFFLACASADRSRAESLYAALSTNHRVFLDSHAVRPGDDWPLTISRALAATRLTIILLSANSEEAHYLRNEISAAIQLARKDARRRVIPVFLDGFPSNITAIPYGLSSIQGLDARKLGMEGIAVELRKAAARHGTAVSQAHETSSPAQDENHTPGTGTGIQAERSQASQRVPSSAEGPPGSQAQDAPAYALEGSATPSAPASPQSSVAPAGAGAKQPEVKSKGGQTTTFWTAVAVIAGFLFLRQLSPSDPSPSPEKPPAEVGSQPAPKLPADRQPNLAPRPVSNRPAPTTPQPSPRKKPPATIDDLRQEHGVTFMPETVRPVSVHELPKGMLGYVDPAALPLLRRAMIGRTATARSFELHKAIDGAVFLIGYVKRETLEGIERGQPIDEALLVANPAGSRTTPVSIRIDRIQKANFAIAPDSVEVLALKLGVNPVP